MMLPGSKENWACNAACNPPRNGNISPRPVPLEEVLTIATDVGRDEVDAAASGESGDGRAGRTVPCFDSGSPALFSKIFRFPLDPNQIYIPRRPVPLRGVSRS